MAPQVDFLPTFGYAGNLSERPPFSKFDVRDEACLSAGGFMHGQVVKDRSGREFVVVGVKPVEGQPKLWFHPRDLGHPGAGVFPDDSAAALCEKLVPVGNFSRAARDARAKLGSKQTGPRHLKEARQEDFGAAEDATGEEVVLCCHCRLPIGDFAYTKDEKAQHLVHADCMARLVQQDFRERAQARERDAAELKAKRRAEYAIGWKPEMIPRNLAAARKLKCEALARGLCCLAFKDGSDSLCLSPTTDTTSAVNLEYLALALQVRFKEGAEPRFSLDPLEPTQSSAQVKRFEPAWLAGTSAGDVLFQADYHLKELSMGEQPQPVVGMKSCLDFSDNDSTTGWRAREWFVVRHAEVQVSEGNVLVPCVKMGVEAREQRVGMCGLEDSRLTRPEHPLVRYADAFTRNFELIAERKSVIYHLRELAKAAVLAKYLLEAGVNLDEFWFSLGEAKQAGCSEIPQLWNERCHSRVRVQDGQIVDSKDSLRAGTHSLYGGVQFGLDIFKLYSAHERQVQGVDLSLDKFSLNATRRAALTGISALPVGKAFWHSLDKKSQSPLDREDVCLLREVFNPSLSDRRCEGDQFVPPAHLESLRDLVKAEAGIRKQRLEHFLSQSFSPGSAGPLFPASWTEAFRVEQVGENKGTLMQVREHLQAHRCEQIMKSTEPAFDETTEDGMRFRIYRLGNVEIRSTQEQGGQEEVGVVYAASAQERDEGAEDSSDSEQFVKVTEFVEHALQGSAPVHLSALECCCYVVLETVSGRNIVTEKLRDGRVTWKEDPEDLEDRNALARVLRSQNNVSEAVTVGTVRRLQANEARSAAAAASAAECRRYAQAIFGHVSGEGRCGFRHQVRGKWWLTGGAAQYLTKDKKSRAEKDYADKTFTMKFSEMKDGRVWTREQYKELKEAITFLVGAHARSGTEFQEHEAIFNVRVN